MFDSRQNRESMTPDSFWWVSRLVSQLLSHQRSHLRGVIKVESNPEFALFYSNKVDKRPFLGRLKSSKLYQIALIVRAMWNFFFKLLKKGEKKINSSKLCQIFATLLLFKRSQVESTPQQRSRLLSNLTKIRSQSRLLWLRSHGVKHH